jgi:HPt (histidine-containing phosphotransfer) domain-containing protein
MAESTPKEVFNLEEALENVGGSQELLCDLAAVLSEEIPKLLQSAKNGISAGDPKSVNMAIHSLKGSVTPFAAQNSVDAAWKLEQLSADGGLENADELLSQLESELERLSAALKTSLPSVG